MVLSCSDVQESTDASMSPSLYHTCCMEEVAGGSSCSDPCAAARRRELLILILIELLVFFCCCCFRTNTRIFLCITQLTRTMQTCVVKMIQNEVLFIFTDFFIAVFLILVRISSYFRMLQPGRS